MLKKINRYLYNDEVDIRLRLYVLSAAMTLSMLFVLSIEVLAFSGRWEQFGVIWAFIALLVVIGFVNIRTKRLRIGAILTNLLISFVLYPMIFIKGGGVEGSGPSWFIFNIFIGFVHDQSGFGGGNPYCFIRSGNPSDDRCICNFLPPSRVD